MKGSTYLFEQFNDPLVYTPGDNEWADCHKKKELSSGAPLNELAAVRKLFSPNPGYTLGGHKKKISTQAEDFDRKHPGDAQFVENVMWDPEALLPGGDGLSNYTIFVHELAQRSLHFGRPVLLINGDSHVFGVDQPLANQTSAAGVIHNTPVVSNLTRITVQGSTSAPAEWLRLSVDPHSPQVFSWENVAYCKDPLTSCK